MFKNNFLLPCIPVPRPTKLRNLKKINKLEFPYRILFLLVSRCFNKKTSSNKIKEERQLFEIYLDKVGLLMLFDYEKHLIICVFSAKYYLDKN